jgi:hypothetical protein
MRFTPHGLEKLHHQQIGVKLFAIIGFTPFYWLLLPIIGYYLLLLAIIGYYFFDKSFHIIGYYCDRLHH